jgi:hypothetical protein
MWLASQEGEKTPPLAPNKPLGQGRQQGARLGLDPAALPAQDLLWVLAPGRTIWEVLSPALHHG